MCIAMMALGLAGMVRAEPLTVGWWADPPYYANAPRAEGAWADLARSLGRDLGREVEFARLRGPVDAAQALAEARIDLVLGAPEISYLPDDAVMARPIHRIGFGRYTPGTGDVPTTAPVGVLAPVPRALQAEIEAERDASIYANVETALGALLLRDIQALVGPADQVEAAVRHLGLADRVMPDPTPRAIIPQFAIWSAAQPDIGEALERHISDGRLDGARARHGITRPVGDLRADRVVRIAVPAVPGLTSTLSRRAPSPVTQMLDTIAEQAGWLWLAVPQGEQADLRLSFGEVGIPLGEVPFSVAQSTTPVLGPVGWFAPALGLAGEEPSALVRASESVSDLRAGLALGSLSAVVAPRASLVAANRDGAGLSLKDAYFGGMPIGLSAVGDRPFLMADLEAALAQLRRQGQLAPLQARFDGSVPFWTPQRLRQLALLCVGLGICVIAGGVYVLGTRTGLARIRLQAKLIQHSQDALIIWSPEAGILDWNRGAERLFGHSRAKALGQQPDTLLEFRQPLIRPGGEAQIWAIDASGREVLIARRREAMTVAGLLYYLDSCRDVTQESRVDILQQLNDTLRQSEADLKAANQDLTAFTYAASHDLRAPTNTMLMLVSELGTSLDDGDLADALDLLEDMRFTAQSMQALTRDLLEFSSVSKSAPRPGPVALEGVLAQVCRTLKSEITATGARITSHGLPLVWSNEGQMRHLLQNLVENAIKFRQPGVVPEVVLTGLPAQNGRVGISVRDNGVGVPDSLRPGLFKPFVRGEPGGARPGHGLGLALCRRIAVQSGGWIELCAGDAPGSEFRVYLEMVQDDQQRVAG